MAEDGTHESTQDLIEELQVEEPKSKKVPDEETEGTEETEESEETKETEEPAEEEEPEETRESDKQKFSEVTKKYPNLFKDFPNLRHIFYHEREYRELFPTVDAAREAAEDIDGLHELENALV